jgi:hypothetical protein
MFCIYLYVYMILLVFVFVFHIQERTCGLWLFEPNFSLDDVLHLHPFTCKW